MDRTQLPRTISLHDRSDDERAVPLHLLPWAVAKQISKTGDKVYRISVKRTHWHLYNVTVRTKAHPRELAPQRVRELAPERLGIPDPMPCIAEGIRQLREMSRGCPAGRDVRRPGQFRKRCVLRN